MQLQWTVFMPQESVTSLISLANVQHVAADNFSPVVSVYTPPIHRLNHFHRQQAA